MRAVTRKAVDAFFSGGTMGSGNTTVVHGSEGSTIMYLHGSAIARRQGEKVEVCFGGYPSKTTAERINAVLGETTFEGFMRCRQGDWYLGTLEPEYDEWIVVQEPHYLVRLAHVPI